LAVASFRHRAVYEQKKVPVLRLLPQEGCGCGCRSPEQYFYYTPLFSRIGAFGHESILAEYYQAIGRCPSRYFTPPLRCGSRDRKRGIWARRTYGWCGTV